MNRYNCFLIVGSELKSITIEADMVHPDSKCATRFQKSVRKPGLYGTPENGFELIGQYPTDKFIIESIEYNLIDDEK
jgi:hypothetical protein